MRMLHWATALVVLGLATAQSPESKDDDLDFDYVRKDFEDRHLLKVGSRGYTDINWLPGRQEMLVTEKDGRVIVFPDWQEDGGSKRVVAWDKADQICDQNERGLHSITLHPNFAQGKRWVYLFYTYRKNDNCNENPNNGPVNRVSKFVMDAEYKLRDEEVLIEGASLATNFHNGGCTHFGNDGFLYITWGDDGEGGVKDDIPNKPHNLLGKILRITDVGTIPAGNPYSGDGSERCNQGGVSSGGLDCREIYNLGIRNPYNFAMDPLEGSKVRFYVNDVGASDFEEISEGGSDFKGDSFGWPLKEGPCKRGSREQCDRDNNHIEPIHWYTHGQEFDEGRSTRAIVGGAFVPQHSNWPMQGDYIFMEYTVGVHWLRKKDSDERRDVYPPVSSYDPVPIAHAYLATRLKFGPDGHLYYLTRDLVGEVRRIRYVGEETVNKAPEADLVVRVEGGGAGLTAFLDATRSTDPEDTPLTYEFDFGDGNTQMVTEGTIDYTYAEPGEYSIRVTVRDSQGARAQETKEVAVGIEPKELQPFVWSTVGCPAGYDACGVLEFCVDDGRDGFGYRLPCEDETACPCISGPGPVIRLVPGTRYQFVLRNSALFGTNPTNIHPHGLHLVGSGDGDDVTRSATGGSCLSYTWDIPADHDGGTYWYHPHAHGRSDAQVSGGAFGMLIVEEKLQLSHNLPSWTANELLLQVSHIDGIVLGNGNLKEQIPIKANVWHRLRVSVVNPLGIAEILRFRQGCEVHKIANDGVWKSQVAASQDGVRSFELTGASRADFAIQCSTVNKRVDVIFAGQVVSELVIDATVQRNPTPLQPWTPARPDSLFGVATANVLNENKMEIDIGQDNINGVKWDPATPLATLDYGAVHEWSLSDSSDHPFHLHLYHMQVVTPGGCGSHEEGEFYDTISGPPCLVRFRAIDIGQRAVLHCHVLSHEASGSMGWVDIQGPGMPINDRAPGNFICDATGQEPVGLRCQPFRSIPFNAEAMEYCGFVDTTSVHRGNCDARHVVDGKLSDAADSCSKECYVAYTEPGESLEYSFEVAENQRGISVSLQMASFSEKMYRLDLLGEGITSGNRTTRPSNYTDFKEYVWVEPDVLPGRHTMRLLLNEGRINLCSVDIVPLETVALAEEKLAEEPVVVLAPPEDLPNQTITTITPEWKPNCRKFDELPFTAGAEESCGYNETTDKQIVECETDVEKLRSFRNYLDACHQDCYIAYRETGEYVDYKFATDAVGEVMVAVNVASAAGRSLKLELLGENKDSGAIQAPDEGLLIFRERTWSPQEVAGGDHTLRVSFEDGSINMCSVSISGTFEASQQGELPRDIASSSFATSDTTNRVPSLKTQGLLLLSTLSSLFFIF